MYDCSGVLGVDELATLEPGRTLLVVGPTAGTDELVRAFLADGLVRSEGAVGITTADPAGAFVEDLAARTDTFEGLAVGVLDCEGDGDRESEQLDSGAYLTHVGSAAALTDLGIGITKTIDRLETAGYDRARLGLTDLATMLAASDEQTVFKFCHVLASRLGSAGLVGLFAVDAETHDARTVQVLRQAVDGAIEVREVDGVWTARVRGLSGEPSEWLAL
jgi:hypothetical protein